MSLYSENKRTKTLARDFGRTEGMAVVKLLNHSIRCNSLRKMGMLGQMT